MPACSVIDCTSLSYKHHQSDELDGILYHQLPANQTLRSEWLRRIGVIPYEIRTKTFFVCSKHFVPDKAKTVSYENGRQVHQRQKFASCLGFV